MQSILLLPSFFNDMEHHLLDQVRYCLALVQTTISCVGFGAHIYSQFFMLDTLHGLYFPCVDRMLERLAGLKVVLCHCRGVHVSGGKVAGDFPIHPYVVFTLCSLGRLRGMVDVYNYIIRVVNILTFIYTHTWCRFSPHGEVALHRMSLPGGDNPQSLTLTLCSPDQFTRRGDGAIR